MILLLLLLGTVGATYVLTQGVITKPVRRIFPPLLCCAMCSGVWVGLIGGGLWMASGLGTAWMASLALPVGWMSVAVVVGCISAANAFLSPLAVIVLLLLGSYVRYDRVGRQPDDPCSAAAKDEPTDTKGGDHAAGRQVGPR